MARWRRRARHSRSSARCSPPGPWRAAASAREAERRTANAAACEPVANSDGSISERESLAVSITDADGVIGHGEAAPLEAYDGVGIVQVQAALERYVPALAESEGMNGAQLVDACLRVEDLPEALAAVDLALWDRGGRALGRPVAAMITDDPAVEVPVNATLSALHRMGVAEQAAVAVQAGFACVKVKVGVATTPAGGRGARGGRPRVALRLDANGRLGGGGGGAHDRRARACRPGARGGAVYGCGAARGPERPAVRVAIDETAAEHGALGAGVADAACLKISRWADRCIDCRRDARTGLRRGGLSRLDAGWTAGDRCCDPRGRGARLAWTGPPCGLATLGLFEVIDNRSPAVRAGSRC